MSDVTRYDVCQYEGDWARMEPCSDGDWVLIESYQALEAENVKLRAELERWAVPDGWKLVPVEPTGEMTFVGQRRRYSSAWSIGAIYREMLAAAPSAPKADEYRCHKCGGKTPPPEPYKAYVLCDCGYMTSATAAIAAALAEVK